MISVEHITKKYGRFKAVDDVSFSVARGEAVALCGPNGAGKTTILSCMLGLLRFDGVISIDGLNTRRHSKAARRAMGYVPQELALYDDLRAGEAIAYFARLRRNRNVNSSDLLHRVGLDGQHRKRIGELSGGMKQRLALALALLDDPPVLILDELTSSLDRNAQRGFLDLLRQVQEQGKTILFTSHRAEEVDALADRVLELESGRLVSERRPAPAAESGGACTLKIIVDASAIDGAMALLTSSGFATRRNGRGLLVEVDRRMKAAPIAALNGASISVQDFELPGHVPAATREGGIS